MGDQKKRLKGHQFQSFWDLLSPQKNLNTNLCVEIVRHPNIDMKRRFLGYDFGGPSFKKVFGQVIGQRIGHHQPEPSLRRLIVLRCFIHPNGLAKFLASTVAMGNASLVVAYILSTVFFSIASTEKLQSEFFTAGYLKFVPTNRHVLQTIFY